MRYFSNTLNVRWEKTFQKITTTFFFITLSIFSASGQSCYWQQHVNYFMDIDFDAQHHQFEGYQKLVYQNNSPDTLDKVYYHLYFNAFQPGSMMDIRSRTIEDPDSRIGDRIYHLKDDETGYLKIKSLKQDGKKLSYKEVGTILEVSLAKPLLPGKSTTFEMDFNGQVPLQIRRSGRDNVEGIAYSMTQWYPKMAEYDEDGWHADPYVAREFYGVWGDFEVKIHIDSSYVLGATGYLQNPSEIGHGYPDKGSKVKRPDGSELTWHFVAHNVHDFAWTADPDYKLIKYQVPEGPELHLLYQPDSNTTDWEKFAPVLARAFIAMRQFGKYPYKQFSVIQGGDGGMEYPMLTLITGERKLGSLLGVTVHEMIHSWYYGVLANNESKYPWMDEGFTSYAQSIILDSLYGRKLINPHYRSYQSYFQYVASGKQEPMSTHSDHYKTNYAYGMNAYSKGAVFLNQLSYIVGQETFMKGMRRYFNEWKFKHPHPVDFKRVMEKTSGLELDWYFEHWLETTRTIDYAIKNVIDKNNETQVMIENKEETPMPLDIEVTFTNGKKMIYYIPLRMMRGEKANEQNMKRIVLKDWPWPYREYEFTINYPADQISSIVIDPNYSLADIVREDNFYPLPMSKVFQGGNGNEN